MKQRRYPNQDHFYYLKTNPFCINHDDQCLSINWGLAVTDCLLDFCQKEVQNLSKRYKKVVQNLSEVAASKFSIQGKTYMCKNIYMSNITLAVCQHW